MTLLSAALTMVGLWLSRGQSSSAAGVEVVAWRWSPLATKRVLDICGALALLAMCLPLLLAVALLVRCSSPGPILFRQTRVGRGGRQFCFYKFRTMAVNAQPAPHLSYFQSFVQGKARPVNGPFKPAQDALLTPVGRFLRYSSLDELPQLINIVRGDMSLVGPRPPIPYETEFYSPREWRRLVVTPGLTGSWQVSGRSCLSFRQMIDLDLEYIDNWSVWLDLVILACTPWSVLRARGAG